jgi:anti-repressor protein
MEQKIVKVENNQIVTDSRTVAESFEKRHDHVLRGIENLKVSLPNFGEMFFQTEMPDSSGRGRMYKTYLMNRDGFTLLAMGFTGSRAMQWKVRYIEAFNEMERELKERHKDSYMIADPVERAKKWIEEETVRKEQAKAIERMKPKEIFSDAVAGSGEGILIGALAKLIQQNGYPIGQKRLFRWLRDNGYLIKQKGSDYNTPTQRAMELGLFKVKERTIVNPDGSVRLTRTTLVTGKGQIYFVNKFMKLKAAEDKAQEAV